MASSRKPALPRYRRVADTLIEGILSGRYPVGTVLPGETEVAAQFAISRHTARDAMRLIEQAGMITRRRRVGSMVVSNELPMRYNQRIESLNDLLQYSNASRLTVLAATEVALDAASAELLRAKPGGPCMFLTGIRHQRHDNRPFAYSEIFFPVERRAVRERMRDPQTAARELTRKVDTPHLSAIEQTLVAEAATRRIAAILKLRPGAALLKSMRVYIGAAGKVVATSTTWHAGDLFSYSTTLTKAS
ncbi:MAG: GntR family transcriptional regulator [Burkholderiales bacterium]|nr:GntR family transcriptional regulator [Burkholderiales bacterium]